MEYKPQSHSPQIQPRLIIHGGAGNINPTSIPPPLYTEYRDALLTIITKAHTYMVNPQPKTSTPRTALDIATHAVTLLEDNPLFNSAHGAVFSRDGLNELEASVMVTRGHAKLATAVTGLRHVRNPILLAKEILLHGDHDLLPKPSPSVNPHNSSNSSDQPKLDIPSAQGHTLLHGPTAEQLATQYSLPLVPQSYFFTQRRWDEHVRALSSSSSLSPSWSATEYLPQGTCGAVAIDSTGTICTATSTGGLTNKLTGRIGDTPSVGSGFWAEEWTVPSLPASSSSPVGLSPSLSSFLSDCLPSPTLYTPVPAPPATVTTRSIALSGTGNGDSFLRTAAARTAGAIARFGGVPAAAAVAAVAGPGGELQRSAGDRWGRGTGEGEGGFIGIACTLVRDAETGAVVDSRSELLCDMNCGGMFRAWVNEHGVPVALVWREEKDKGVPP